MCVLQGREIGVVVFLSCSLQTPSFSRGNLTGSDQVTAKGSLSYRHDQSICYGNANSGSACWPDWNDGVFIMLVVRPTLCLYGTFL